MVKKVTLALTLILLVTIISHAQQSPDYSKILPGVVKINDSVYYDRTEVSNFYWLEYLHWAKTNEMNGNTGVYAQILPDTGVWVESLKGYGESYQRLYLRSVQYRDYPLVGVSWQQASDFCEWRTQMVLKNLAINGNDEEAPLVFRYRLPTYAEFVAMYDNAAQLPDLIGDEGPRKYRGLRRFNMKFEPQDAPQDAGRINDNADVTARVESYWPNEFGLYNLRGNVAEWLSEPYHYAGGAWNDLYSADVRTVRVSQAPSASIGFRCVCEISNELP